MVTLIVPDLASKRRADRTSFVLMMPFVAGFLYLFWKCTFGFLVNWLVPTEVAATVSYSLFAAASAMMFVSMYRDVVPGGTKVVVYSPPGELTISRGNNALTLTLGEEPALRFAEVTAPDVPGKKLQLELDLGRGGKARAAEHRTPAPELCTETVGVHRLSAPFDPTATDAVAVVRGARRVARCLGVKLTGPDQVLGLAGPVTEDPAAELHTLNYMSGRELLLTFGLMALVLAYALPPIFRLPVHGKGFSWAHFWLFVQHGLPATLVAVALRMAAFDDHWIIDPARREIRDHRRFLGWTFVLPFARFDDIAALELSQHHYKNREGEPRSVDVLDLALKSGRRYRLDACELDGERFPSAADLASALAKLVPVAVKRV